MTATTAGPGTAARRDRLRHARRSSAPSIEMAGVLIVLLGAWGGIAPFVGPTFGMDGEGSVAWQWNLTHALVNLAPGAAAVFAGLLVMGAGRALSGAGRLALGGLLAALCGAWLVVAPVAWPALEHMTALGAAPPVRELAYWVGYALGPGGLLLALGAFVLGRPVAVRPARAGDVASPVMSGP